MTNANVCKFFNEIVNGENKNDLMKRVTVNGMTSSSWRSKRFERIGMIVTDVNKKPIVSSWDGLYRFWSKSFRWTKRLDDNDDKSHLDTRDLQSEMFFIEERNNVEFDEFAGSGKCSELFQ